MTPEPSPPGNAAPARREALNALTREALRSIDRGAVVVSRETRSMAPFLRGGERIHWRRGPRPRTGDLLLFLGRPGPVVHRVVGRRGEVLVTQGDNRPVPDVEPVATDDVVGVVVAVERGGRRWDLGRRGPRFYAAGAASLSRAGGALYRVAVLADAALRRVLPGGRDVRPVRTVAWALLRGVRVAFHFLLFRPCHGAGYPVEEDADR